jgi:nucleotide-binding universal stress UspA family protein
VEWYSLVLDQNYRSRTAAGLSTLHGLDVEFSEVDGMEGPALGAKCARIGADLVIMATHGRGGIERLRLGSVTDYMVRHLNIPILIVHPDPQATLPEPGPVRRILVALDLSPESDLILPPITALARTLDASLTLVHIAGMVYPAPIPPMPMAVQPSLELQEASRLAAQQRLETLAGKLCATGLKADTLVLSGAGAADGLLDLLKGTAFDMAAMTTHGRGGLGRALFGSVADRVIRETAKPVLVLRPAP